MIGRRVPFCLFALMVLPWGGPAYGHEGPNPCDCPDTLAPVFSPELVIAEVTAAEAALVVANNSGDPMAQFEHYADDYVYIDSGGKRITKAQLLERRQADERSPLTEASDFEVLPISADAAISRGRWDDRAVYYGGLPRVSSARYMALWRKRDGRWRLVADQGTPIVERQTIVRERLTLEDGTLGSFAGRYALDLQPPLAIELSVADGGLLLKIPGHLEDGVRFVPSGPSSFFAVERPWELAFDTAGGNIVLTTWGEETRGQRLSRPPGAR